ncbi:hypothetical protein [Sphingomonas sp. dw_22]|nr:hypothetical protein [Sphingomonas sp. dw_22]
MARTLMVASRFAMRQPRVVIGVSGLACLMLAQLAAALMLGAS